MCQLSLIILPVRSWRDSPQAVQARRVDRSPAAPATSPETGQTFCFQYRTRDSAPVMSFKNTLLTVYRVANAG